MKSKFRYFYLMLVSLFMSSLLLLWPGQILANGGTPIFSHDVGPYNVLVTETPSPPSPDVSTHLTVLLTRASSDLQVRNANLIFTPAMSGMAMPGADSRRSFQGQQPNTYDVDLPLTMEGDWVVHVQVSAPGFAPASFDLNLKIEKPSPPWPFIIGILVGLPVLAALTWWLLFRSNNNDDDEDEDFGSKRKPKATQGDTRV